MNTRYYAILFLALLGSRRKKTIRLTPDFDKYFSRKGRVDEVECQMGKMCGCTCMISIDRNRGRLYIKSLDTYITKGKLSARWSMRLINKFFAIPTRKKPNPYYSSASPMCLYSMAEIKRIEECDEFKREFRKVAERKAKFLQRQSNP